MLLCKGRLFEEFPFLLRSGEDGQAESLQGPVYYYQYNTDISDVVYLALGVG